ncbi:MAG: hypothetical protein ACLVAT_08000 [Lachnospiraceae bacterium]
MRHIGEKIILVLCIVVFGIAAMNLVEIGKEYYDGQKEYEELKEYTEEEPNGQQDDPAESKAEEKTIDFAELRKINEDIVAWIQIPGIDVDYPVVQGEDNEYYLYHTFRKEANKAGSIFLDYRNYGNHFLHPFCEYWIIISMRIWVNTATHRRCGKILTNSPQKHTNCHTKRRFPEYWNSDFQIFGSLISNPGFSAIIRFAFFP